MSAMTNPNEPDYRISILRSIASSIEPAFPSAAIELRGIADSLGRSTP